MRRTRVLIIGDITSTCEALAEKIETTGCRTTCTEDVECGNRLIKCNPYDAVILCTDGESGFTSKDADSFRKRDNIRVLSAGGIVNGCDGIISKPYRTDDISKKLKYYSRPAEKQRYSFGDVVLNTDDSSVYKKDSPVYLSQREYELLLYLCKHKNTMLTKEQIISDVWNSSAEPSTLTVHIRWLREKLEDNPGKPEYIKTVWGSGYILEC